MRYAVQAIGTVLLLALWASAAPAGQPGPLVFADSGDAWGSTSYLGVDTRDITPDRLAPLHLKEEKGVEVTMVDQDAPAGKSGIKEHDVILSINDQQVESVEQLRRLIREIPPGRVITIGISRDGQPLTLHAQLAERDKMPGMNFNFNAMPAMRVPPNINIPEIDVPNIVVIHAPRNSGLMIENLTPQLGEYFGVKGGNGVLVRSVDKGSRAEQAGIKAGDVIVKINGSTVSDCSDFSRLLRSRTANKASVTVMRDRREQTLNLVLPQPRPTGSFQLENCEELMGEKACAELRKQTAEIASVAPEMNTELQKMKKQLQEEMQRQRPEMEKLQKELQAQMLAHRGEWEKDLQTMRRQMEQQRQELKRKLREMQKQATEI